MRFKNLVSIGALMTMTLTASLAAAKVVPVTVEPAAQAAAVQALKDHGGQRLSGMPAAHQMDKTTLGEPLVVKMVQLDDLQRYQPGIDAATLLRETQTMVYPIRVAGQIHGEMVMGKVDGSWSARGFAGPGRVKALDAARGQVTGAAALPAGSTMIVVVPALNLEFVAYTDASGLKLTPVTSLPTAGLTAGQTLPAARVFELLTPLAVAHNGLPG
jgi:hypothetical protein